MSWDWDNLTKEDILEMNRLDRIRHAKALAKITFWDDIGYKNTINGKGKEEKVYYSCTSLQHWNKHIATPKYKKMYKAVQEDANSIKCEHCNQKFSEEGYENHCNRNKELWKWQKLGMCMMMTCNNFKEGGRRFASIEHYKDYCSEKGKKKSRANVGEEKVDGTIRLPMNVKNVNKAKYNAKIDKIQEKWVLDETEKDSLDNLKMTVEDLDKKVEVELNESDYDVMKSYELTDKDVELLDKYNSQPDDIPVEDCDECVGILNNFDGISDEFFSEYLGWAVCTSTNCSFHKSLDYINAEKNGFT